MFQDKGQEKSAEPSKPPIAGKAIDPNLLPADSDLGKRAAKAGLDLGKPISKFDVVCAELKLDPKKTSFLDVAAVKMGKKPGTISSFDAEQAFGKNWALEVTK